MFGPVAVRKAVLVGGTRGARTEPSSISGTTWNSKSCRQRRAQETGKHRTVRQIQQVSSWSKTCLEDLSRANPNPSQTECRSDIDLLLDLF